MGLTLSDTRDYRIFVTCCFIVDLFNHVTTNKREEARDNLFLASKLRQVRPSVPKLLLHPTRPASS